MGGRLRTVDAVWPLAILSALGIVLPTTPNVLPSVAPQHVEEAVSVTTTTAASASPVSVVAASTTVAGVVASSTGSVATTTVPNVAHMPLPSEVRGLYWTAWTAGSSHGQNLLSYMLNSGLNTVVIDLKVDDGELGFTPHDPSLRPYAQKYPAIRDLDALLKELGQKNIYRIARIFIMRDGAFGRLHPNVALQKRGGGIWTDKTGTPWLDPAAPSVADYAVTLAKEAYARGFDEVQFDYVRFPSDGTLTGIVYPVYDGKKSKQEVMQEFFNHVGGAMKAAGIPVSFDVFGMTFWRADDFGIGQRMQDVVPEANFISPMAYPSHYPDGFQGFANPADHPYDIVKGTLDQGVKLEKLINPFFDEKRLRLSFRPWIQDFEIGATYTAPMIEAEIKAARDAGASGFLIWNARNVYQPAAYVKN